MLTLEQVMSKSAKKIATLEEPLRTAAKLIVERSYVRNVYVIITEALRTYEYQNSLYAQGRTKPGQIVTNARGGYSNHNFGYAFDFALLMSDGRQVSWNTLMDADRDSIPDWDEVVQVGRSLGLEWGGDWRSFKDLPHFQLVFGLSTADYRNGRRPSATQINAALNVMQPKVDPIHVPVVKEPVALLYTFQIGKEDAGKAFVYDKASYVPMVALAKFIGVSAEWDNDEKQAKFNGRVLTDFKSIDGRIYVQLRPIATAYQKSLFWDGKSKIVGVA